MTPRDKSSKGFPGRKSGRYGRLGGMSGSRPANVGSARNCQSVWQDGSWGVVNDKAGKADVSPDHKGPPRLR